MGRWPGDSEEVWYYESVWVVIHMCMEAMLGISLYSYPYLKLAQMLCLSYYCLCLLFNKIGKQGELRGKGGGRGPGGEMAQTMCAHTNKWINK
jgi:hypothetical protein